MSSNKVILKQSANESQLSQLINAQKYNQSLILENHLHGEQLINSINHIKNLTQLTDLTFKTQNNGLKSQASLIEVVKGISELPQLKSLTFSILEFYKEDLFEFCKVFGKTLKQLDSLEKFHFITDSIYQFENEGAKYLNQGIMSLSNLKTLIVQFDLCDNKRNTEVLQILFKDLNSLDLLKDIQLCYKDNLKILSDGYFKQLREAITTIKWLSQLELRIVVSKIQVNEFQDFFDDILQMSNLKSLNIKVSVSFEQDDWNISLFQNVKTVSAIENLDILFMKEFKLSKCTHKLSIDGQGVLNLKNLRSFLLKTTLQINNFNLEKLFNLFVQQRKILSQLRLSIFDQQVSAQSIGKMIKELTFLKDLGLDITYKHDAKNKIGIIEAISQMKDLEVIMLQGELDKLALSQKGYTECFKQLNKLRILKLNCAQTEQAFKVYNLIAQSLEQLPNLLELDLTNHDKNNDQCFNIVCESFSHLKNLQILKLSYLSNIFQRYPNENHLKNILSLPNLIQLDLELRFMYYASESFCSFLKQTFPSLKKLIKINFRMQSGYFFDKEGINKIAIRKSIKLVEKSIVKFIENNN